MDPKITLTPTLRIDRIGTAQGEAQSRKSPFPFTRGQMVQGVITGRSAENQFYLDVNGTRFVAESRAPLHVGQQLDLQVVTTHPRTTLHVVEDPLTREIGKSLHLLTHQDALLTETSILARKSGDSPDLSPQARQTLRFFTAAAAKLSMPVAPEQAPGEALAVLTGRLATAVPGDADAQQAVAALKELLVRLTGTDSGRPETVILAQETLRELGIQEQSLPPGPAFLVQGQPVAQEGATGLARQVESVLQQVEMAAGTQGDSEMADLLLSLFPDRRPQPSRLLLMILDLHQRLTAPESSSSPVRLQGEDLKQLTDRLGLDMERLLAEGRPDEAVQTLKNALLEISRTMAETGQAERTADRLLGTIELYQMLQVRLAAEGLFFLPLPLPFLNQGYLLVEEDAGRRQESGDEEPTTFHLHLQLQGLGNVQVDIIRQGEGVGLRFLAQDPERAGFLAEHRDELEQWLTALRLDSVSFLAGASDPAATLLRKMLPAGSSSGILDTRA